MQSLPHAMQVGSGRAMRAVRDVSTLWKRWASRFLASFSVKFLGSGCCNRGCQCHEVPPGVSISCHGGPKGLRSQCRMCHGSSWYLLKQLPLFSKLQCSNLLQSSGVLCVKPGTGLAWNGRESARVRFRAAKKLTLKSCFQLVVGSCA